MCNYGEVIDSPKDVDIKVNPNSSRASPPKMHKMMIMKKNQKFVAVMHFKKGSQNNSLTQLTSARQDGYATQNISR